jgi:ADP-heptose:LPS heptosyltransferase
MKPARIGVFRALQLGDMLCLVPALRALRRAYPGAEITLISLPWADDFARRLGRYIDRFEVFPGVEGFPEQTPNTAAWPGFLAAMRERRFDLLLQCHGSGELSNPMLAGWGARRQAGFHAAGQTPPDRASFMVWDEERNEVLRFLDLLELLGVPSCGTAMELPLNEEDSAELKVAAPMLAPAGTYVCIHPGARFSSRRWSVQRFAAVAELAAGRGLQVVLTGSPAEASLCEQLETTTRAPVLNLAGRTSLGALAALVAGARLLICNDTGLSHVAAALATPSVVISSGSNARRWSPLDRELHRVLWTQLDCRPCMHRECPLAGHPCASAVTVADVWKAAQPMLDLAQASPHTQTAKENA